jgi:hypothetical protein
MIYIQSICQNGTVYIRLTPEGQILGTQEGPSALSLEYQRNLARGGVAVTSVCMHMIEFDPRFHLIDDSNPGTMAEICAIIGPDPHFYTLSGESMKNVNATRCNGEGAMEWHVSGKQAKL